MPNLAIIESLKKEIKKLKYKVDIQYICSRSHFDQQILKKNHINFLSIYTWKIRRYFDFRTFFEIFAFIGGFFQSLWILIRFKPHIIFLKGGFVCVPVALAGFILRRKMIAHESDQIPGVANRLIAPFVHTVCTGFPIKGKKYHFTGNPLRSGVITGNKEQACRLTGFKDQIQTILIMGGSQGAVAINKMIETLLPKLVEQYQVIHLTGLGKALSFNHIRYKQFEFLENDELFHIYKITDLAITRGGANALSELAANFIPMLIIPLPHSANQHQFYNAQYLLQLKTAKILDQKKTSSSDLYHNIQVLLTNTEKLKKMRLALKKHSFHEISQIIIKTALIYFKK